MKGKFTKIMAALALLVFMMPSVVAWGQTTVTWPGTTALPGTATAVANDQNITIMVSTTNTYTNPIRIYANTTVTISANNGAYITSIAYEASSTGNYVTVAQNATVTPEVTPTVNGKIVTWTYAESDNVTEFTFTPSAQTRSNGISITYQTSGGTPACATPSFSPASGTYLEAQDVTISTTTEGATIYYTTDGSEPSTSSSVYSSAINVSSNMTIKAMATATGYDNSAVATAEYTIATLEHDGTLEDPYSVADAHIAILANTGVTGVYVTGIVSQIVTAYNSQYGNITFDLVDEEGSTVTLRAYRCVGDEAEDVTVGDIAVVSGNLTLYGSTYEFEQNCQLVSLTHPQPATIILNPTSIDLGNNNAIGEQITRTITVSQLNLTSGITLNLQGNGAIDVTSISMGAEPTTVTWTYTPTEVGNINATITATSTGAETKTLTISGAAVVPVTGDCYEMVTEALEDWSGYYIITGTNSNNYYALTGVARNLGTTAAVTVIGNSIESNATTDAYRVLVAQTENGYSFYMDEVGYLGYNSDATSGSNYLHALESFEANTCEWTISMTDCLATITNVRNEGRTLQFNYNSGNSRFACYTSNQVKPTLFKYTGTVVVPPSISANNVSIESTATSGSISYTITNGVEGGVLSAATDDTWVTLGTVGETIPFTCSANTGAERTATVTLTYTYNDGETVEQVVTITQAAYVTPTQPSNWVLTNLADLTAGDVFVIVGTNDLGDHYYAMSNDKGTSAPTAVSVTVAENTLSGEIGDNLQWNLTASNSGYTFYPAGSATTWLYCTNTNNGVKVGTGEAKHFTLSQNGYMTTTETSDQRYIGIYNSQDWRCYTSEGGNIASQSFAFYKKVSDDVTYNKAVTAYEGDGGYVLIASPVASVTPSASNGFLTSEYDLYYFDQSEDQEWRNYEAGAFNLTSGKGYLYASSTDTQLTFTGQPYNGNGVVALDYDADAALAGWNLVGNPFDAAATCSKAFYRLNSDGSEVNAETETGSIAAMEGVFVVAEASGETITFTKGGSAKVGEMVVMNVIHNRGNVIDRAILRFDEGQQLPKFQLNSESTKLYIPQGNNDFAVVRSAAHGELPVNFQAKENGTYTIRVNTENVEMDYLHLIDNMTGADVDLLATPSYTFEATTRDYASRFRLVFSANETDGPSTGSGSFAYFNGSEWQISNIGEATLQVVDVMGRIVKNVALEGNATVSINEKSGVYMMRLLNGNDVKVQKVIIK